MKRPITLIASFLFFTISCISSHNNELTNTKWEGFIKVKEVELKLIFNLDANKCFLDIPAQGIENYPIKKYKITNDSLNITMCEMIDATFSGVKIADSLIVGNWIQSGKTYHPIS